jgi:tripartite-type tricarboxylate transporter receptor subunit TctC
MSMIDNVPGAAGILGAERAVWATPDGYTIVGIADSMLTAVSLLNQKVDPSKEAKIN